MVENKKEVIVIGAGMGGLSSAIMLQHAGFQVSIYEQNNIPGGKMARIQKDGFSFDVGPTIVMMPELYEEVFTLVGKDPADYIELIKLDPLYDVYFDQPEGMRHYTVNSELDEFMKTVESRGEESAKGFLHYLADMYDRYQIAMKDFIRRPFRYPSDFYNPYMIKQALKLKTFDTASNMMARYIPDKDLQQMLAFQTLYIGVSPKNGPSLYNIIPMIELLYGVYFVKGGMHQMARAMAKLFTDLGGEIHYNQKVSEIVIEDQQVEGIIANGEFIPSQYVISNVDFPTTITSLVKDEKARGKYTPEKVDNMDYSCSCLVFYWGVEGEDRPVETHNFIIGEDLDRNLDQIFSGELIDEPSVYLHVPTKTDPSLAPEGHHGFYVLLPVPALDVSEVDYNRPEVIEYYRRKALKLITKIEGLEDVAESIVSESVVTPEDFKALFGAYNGSTFGLQPTLLQSNHFRPQSKSLSCEGLYFTGSSTHPGAGVPTAIEGGRICAKELMKDAE